MQYSMLLSDRYSKNIIAGFNPLQYHMPQKLTSHISLAKFGTEGFFNP